MAREGLEVSDSTWQSGEDGRGGGDMHVLSDSGLVIVMELAAGKTSGISCRKH